VCWEGVYDGRCVACGLAEGLYGLAVWNMGSSDGDCGMDMIFILFEVLYLSLVVYPRLSDQEMTIRFPQHGLHPLAHHPPHQFITTP
jgi:hypothetical protein